MAPINCYPTLHCLPQYESFPFKKMPKSRKRHHSRSRSRSRSNSHEKTRDEKHRKNESNDRDGKRRKIDNYDSPHQKRSVSAEHEGSNESSILETNQAEQVIDLVDDSSDSSQDSDDSTKEMEPLVLTQDSQDSMSVSDESQNTSQLDTTLDKNKKKLDEKLNITPKKVLSPKQLQKKLESEKKRQERKKEREEKERQKNEEKERIRLEKLKQKQEKDEQKKKEKELRDAEKQKKREEKEEIRRKELEEKEQKRREREEKEQKLEQKRKEKEQEKLKRQQELEEKNKEKMKEEMSKTKTAKAFVNFFVAKKSDGVSDGKKREETVLSSLFKPFEVKSDMRLPLNRRDILTDEEKAYLEKFFDCPDETKSYLADLKDGKPIGKSPKTWPYEDESNDIEVIEDDVGESICEDKPKISRLRAKFLKFHENRRPPYHGTWRKKSRFISGRKPFGEDKETFDYEVDSDDDWEEEEQGESINGSDDEDKENEPEDDYEVDNEFFVPHGHLSDDEIDDEETSKLSPEDLKQKLKLLKDEFDSDMQSKTQKLKSRSIGCIWYNKDGSCDEEAIDRYLKPLAIISNGPIIIKKRCEILIHTSGKRKQSMQELEPEVIVSFLKVIHGNTNKKRILVEQFLTHIGNENSNVDIGKFGLYKHLNMLASWKKCTEEGPLRNKFCWVVNEDVQKKYNVDLSVVKN